MESLQLQQALVDAGMPPAGSGAASSFLLGLCQRLGIAGSAGGVKQQFFDLLTHLLSKAPSLACSWLSDYLAVSTTLVSSDPDEAYVLQPQSVLAWCQQTATALQQRVGAFLRSEPSARVDVVLELQQTAQSLLSVAAAVQAASSTSSSSGDEVQRLVHSLTQLQQATKVLQVLEQLQQQQVSSPGRPQTQTAGWNPNSIPNGTPATASAGSSTGAFGQHPLFRPHNAACSAWQQQLEQRRAASPEGRLFLDDLLQQLQRQARLQDSSPALAYPYQDVLACVDVLFVGGSGTSRSSSSSGTGAWHAKLAVLLYYLLDGGWLGSAEPFAQGFQLPLTMAQQWQCHHLLDAAAGGSGRSSTNAAAAAHSVATLDKACHLLGAIACPSTPFRFVEALLQAGRPATALAVQRARCAGGSSSSGGSSSLNEAEVLLRVQLGCDLLAEAFCDLRRHCNQVAVTERPRHIDILMRQLIAWALSPAASPTDTAAVAAATAAASSMQQQLQLQDRMSAAAAAGAIDAGSSGSEAGRVRQQQLLQLPLNAAEEGVLVTVLRERMAAGKAGGHLLALYLLQRGRTLEALNTYADYKASPAAAGAGPASTQAADAQAAASSRALLHKRLDAVMAAAAAALPPALRTAATAAGSASGDGGVRVRSVLAGLGGSEVRRVVGEQGGAQLLLQQRGVEPPAFLAPLLSAAAIATGGSSAAAMAATPAGAAGTAGVKRVGVFSSGATGSALSSGAVGARTGLSGAATGGGKDSIVRPLLFEQEALAGLGTATARRVAGREAAGDAVPLLFGTPAPAAAGGGVVRGGLFDTPAAGGGVALWGQGGETADGGFAGWSEADFERQVRFATPQPKAAGAGGGGGVFTNTGKRTHKRLRKTPM